MIIKDGLGVVEFSEIPRGDIFKFNDEVFMAIDEVIDEDGIVNSVDLFNGNLTYFEAEEKVKKVSGYLQIQ